MAKPTPKKHTLEDIAKASLISRKTVQGIFAKQGAPDRTAPLQTLVDFVKGQAPAALKMPDLTEAAIIKFETAKHRRDEKREAAEKLRLWNLEKKGQLIERAEVRAQGAALGILLSSTISKWVSDMPAVLSGKSTREMTLTLRDEGDKLIAQIRETLEKGGNLRGVKTEEENA